MRSYLLPHPSHSKCTYNTLTHTRARTHTLLNAGDIIIRQKWTLANCRYNPLPVYNLLKDNTLKDTKSKIILDIFKGLKAKEKNFKGGREVAIRKV